MKGYLRLGILVLCGALGGCGSGGGTPSSELRKAEDNVETVATRYPSGWAQVCEGWAGYGESAYVRGVEESGYGDVPYPEVEPAVMAEVITTKCGEEVGKVEETSDASPQPSPPLYPQRAKVIREAGELCSLIDAKSVASEYGGDPSDLASVARAYAQASYRPAFQEAAETACLKTLRR